MKKDIYLWIKNINDVFQSFSLIEKTNSVIRMLKNSFIIFLKWVVLIILDRMYNYKIES